MVDEGQDPEGQAGAFELLRNEGLLWIFSR